MATAVQIELMVDEKGAVQGIRSFDTAVKGTTGSVRALNTQLEASGVRATTAGRQTRAALDQTGVAALSSVEKTRLLTEEFGVRLPRAMVRLAAESKAVQATISAIGTGLIGLGAIQIGAMVFTQLIDGAEKLWHNYLNVNAALEDYNAEMEKAKNQDFGNTHSIETTTLRIQEATQQIKAYRQAADALSQKANNTYLHAFDPAAPYMSWQARTLNSQAMDWQRKLDTLQRQRQPEQTHQANLDQIELQHAGDARLRGEQKITAELEKQRAINAENARYEAQQEGVFGNPVAKGGIWQTGHLSKEGTEDLKAQAAADAERFNLQREQAQELAHLREAAVESGLRGSALYHAQEAAAIDDLQYKDIDRAKAVEYIREKFHNEEMKRLEDQRRETEELQGRAALGGFTGIAKIQAQGDLEIGKINGDHELPDEEKAKRIAAVRMQTNAEILQAEQEFTDRTNSLANASADKQVAGFARVRVEADRQIEAARKDFERLYQTPESQQAHAGEWQARVGTINSGADQDASELARRNGDETLQIEMEARARSMSAEKQQTMAIQAEYDARLAKYQEELNKQEISEDDFNRRVIAAEEQRNAEMVEAAKQAREKMAGELSRFFSNPMQAMKEMGDKAAGEAAAAMVQRMQGRYATGGSTGEHLGMPGGGWEDSIFGGIAGAPRRQNDRTIEGRGRETSNGMISIAAAQIRVGNATIAFGGSSGAGSSFTPGSTSLIGGAQISPALSTVSGSGGDFSTSSSGAGTVRFAGPGGAIAAASTIGGGTNTAIGGVQQGLGFFNQAKGIFGSKGSAAGSDSLETQSLDLAGSFDKNGQFNLGGGKSGFGSSMLGGGGVMANAGGVAGGAMGMYSAVEGNGGVGGALSGAMSGMQLGMALGGPLGAAIGAGAGAIIGAIGFGGREKARVYDLKTVQPRISSDIDNYQQGAMDYGSAYSDIQSLDMEARKTLKGMGQFGDRYYWNNVIGEIHQAEGKLTAEQRAGRSNYTVSGASYAVGADSIPETGWNLNHEGERIIKSDQNERITRALEAGASSESIARGYRAAMTASNARQWGGSGDRTVNMNFHTLDSKTAARMFMDNKHHIRAALNASFAENSGGADA